jgi:hypothetical protein
VASVNFFRADYSWAHQLSSGLLTGCVAFPYSNFSFSAVRPVGQTE